VLWRVLSHASSKPATRFIARQIRGIDALPRSV
jgi:hypothetical protein